MNREDKQMIIIYALITIIIILLVLLTKIVTATMDKPKEEPKTTPKTVDTNPFPTVNTECVFDTTIEEYNKLEKAGCDNGYTRYNINANLAAETLKVSVIYSDITSIKTGVFIGENKVASIEAINKVSFGVFENKLFIHVKNSSETNALAYNSNGKEVYNLKTVLEKNDIKDQSAEGSSISAETIDPNSFIYAEGVIEFNSFTNTCQNGEQAKGSKYRVTYSGEEFELPEFVELIKC